MFKLYYLIFILFNILSYSCISCNTIESISCDEDVNEIDRAKIFFITDINDNHLNISLFAINSECYKCSKTFVAKINHCALMYTPFSWTLFVLNVDTNEEITHSIDYTFGEQGEYTVSIPTGYNNINVKETKEPLDSMKPLIVLLSIIFVIIILSYIMPYFIDYIKINYMHNISERDSYLSVSLIDENDVSSPVSGTHRGSNGSIRKSGSKESLNSDNDKGSDGRGSLSSKASNKVGTNVGSPSTYTTINTTTTTTSTKAPRLKSLDSFRGITLTLMIFVNYGGGGYWFLDHAPWNGLTFADVLFPWFMWIMGVSMALSFASSTAIATTTNIKHNWFIEYIGLEWLPWIAVYKRSAILFAIGMFLANGYEYTTWRIPGVLQYFSVSYCVTACTVLYMKKITNKKIEKIKELEKVEDERTNMWQLNADDSFCTKLPSRILLAYSSEWVIQIAILIVYLSIALAAKEPNCPAGYNGPGGISSQSNRVNCTGGIHRYIDMEVFGYELIYHHPTCLEMYQCQPYDPEGLLGVLSACTLTYLGLMAGRVLLHFKDHKARLTRWLIWSCVLLFISGCLSGFSKNEGAIPINKNLWSTSFVFVTSGFGLLGLSLCYILIDMLNVWSGKPFLFLGMNSILIYVGHSLLGSYMPFGYMIYDFNHSTVLTMNVLGVCCWIAVSYYCYHIKFFVKI